jgi:hypothetical protein
LYLTLPGKEVAEGQKNLAARVTTAYNTIAKKYSPDLTPSSRTELIKKNRAYVQGLKTVTLKYYEHFIETHPEYAAWFRYMDNSPANEDEF